MPASGAICLEPGLYRADCPPRHTKRFEYGRKLTACPVCHVNVNWTWFANF